MSIFRSAYDTTALSGYVLKPIAIGIEKAQINGWTKYVGEGRNIYVIEGRREIDHVVPPFAHPFEVKSKDPDPKRVDPNDQYFQKDHFVVDVRPWGRWNDHKGEFTINNQIEYRLAVLRGRLNTVWIQEPAARLRDVSTVPAQVFASWISEALTRRFSLEPNEQQRIAVFAAYYYYSLFLDEMGNHDAMRIVQGVSKATNTKPQAVLDILDDLEDMGLKDKPIDDVKQFVNVLRTLSGSVRLADLSHGLLFTVLQNSLIVANGPELLAVALEHPPTWLTIVLAAATERSYKKSAIALIVERIHAGNAVGDFVLGVNRLTQ